MSMTLVLNTSYEPLIVVGWQRAVTLLFQGKAEVIESHDEEIHSISFTMKIPSVMRMLRMVKFKHRTPVKFTRLNIFARDGHVCQYCAQKFESEELTFDHIVPVAQGGKKTWENIATACVACNTRKEGRTPEQAGMKLIRKPRQPVWSQMITITIGIKAMPKNWTDYLYWNAVLE